MMRTARRALLGLAVMVSGGAYATQDKEHYEQAFANHSTSPSFVLVTIMDETTGSSFTGCIEANFVTGAIFRELGGNFDQTPDAAAREADRALLRKAEESALRNSNHLFHFTNPNALANVQLSYTEDDLAQAREAVRSIGLKPLMDYQSPQRASLGKLQWSAALACAIIEAGGSARRADVTGQILASP